MNLRLPVFAVAWCFLLSTVIGCSEASNSICGKVTYKGKPVQNGAITFQPADGKGPSTGGTITGGTYRVDNIAPGPKIVEILGFESIPFARTTEELSKQAEQNAPMVMATEIPADAEGNNVTIEVTAGHQTRDFDLN